MPPKGIKFLQQILEKTGKGLIVLADAIWEIFPASSISASSIPNLELFARLRKDDRKEGSDRVRKENPRLECQAILYRAANGVHVLGRMKIHSKGLVQQAGESPHSA